MVTSGRGRGNIGMGVRHKLLGVRYATACIVQHGEYSQYFVTIANGV